MTDTILEALNKLVEKSGGDPSDNKLIVDAINDLVETGGGGTGGGVVALRITYDEQTQTAKMDKTYNELLALSKNGVYIFFLVPGDAPSIEAANSIICYSLTGLYAADEYNPYEAIFFTGDPSYTRMRFTATSADEDMTMTNS